MARKRKAAGALLPNPRRSPRLRDAEKQAVTPSTEKGASAAKKLKVDRVGGPKSKKDEVEKRTLGLAEVASKKKSASGKVTPGKEKVAGSFSRSQNDVSAKGLEKVRKKAKQSEEEASTGNKKAKAGKREVSWVSMESTIIVEACTQCTSFKQRAEKVKTDLESAIPGIAVQINPQKPRRGYFEIREERTEVILSLPSMKRPFTEMKQLNMDKVVKDLIKRCH